MIIMVGIYIPAVFHFTTKSDKKSFKKPADVQERGHLSIDFIKKLW